MAYILRISIVFMDRTDEKCICAACTTSNTSAVGYTLSNSLAKRMDIFSLEMESCSEDP